MIWDRTKTVIKRIKQQHSIRRYSWQTFTNNGIRVCFNDGMVTRKNPRLLCTHMPKATCFNYFLRSTLNTGKTGFRSRQFFEKFLKSSSCLCQVRCPADNARRYTWKLEQQENWRISMIKVDIKILKFSWFFIDLQHNHAGFERQGARTSVPKQNSSILHC